MLTEEFFSAVSGPPLAANTSVSKDIGIYHQVLSPSYAVKSSFKKSAAPPNGLAVGANHVFAAQADKAHVHVYSRLRGNMEALVAFPERLRCVALQGDVLLLGTSDGRLILWETCTGRQITTPACHVQAVTCIASTPHHVLTASDDSNVHVWSLPRLLELDAAARSEPEPEPEHTLSHHRGAVTAVVAGRSLNPETGICVTASRDKTCIIWNHHTGDALRTILFSAPPTCIRLDPAGRALFAGCEDSAIYLVELFGPAALLGGGGGGGGGAGGETVHVKMPLGVADSDAGPPACLAVSFDGTVLLSGHSKGKILRWDLSGSGHASELADLNSAVTNVYLAPLFPESRPATKTLTVVKPTQAGRQYAFTARLEGDLAETTTLGAALEGAGFPQDMLEGAVAALAQPGGRGGGSEEALREKEELWEIIREQRELQKATFQKYMEVKDRQ